jgi:Asp-tRNA(Asn)/Glu-tRNA(Gln) amidotransferase A subunit family amidase
MMDSALPLTTLSAADAAAAIAAGDITAVALTEACLAHIAETDDDVQAWAWLDAEYALAQAERADEIRAAGLPLGSLHGVPVAIKDIFDTADMPTEYGTVLHAGRRPGEDSAVAALLRQAGAVIMGKAVTTELAMYGPGKTRNPHDPTRTPGGSSSGSAAAVAAGMVPLAVGSQTAGSVIRPASYCGVIGYKPTHGRVSRRGALILSPALDTVGFFARSIEDVAMIGDALAHYDPADGDMTPTGPLGLVSTAAAEPPVEPVFAFVRSPVWDRAHDDTRKGFAELNDALGERCDPVDLPEPFDRGIDWHRTVMYPDIAKNVGALYDRGADKLSEMLQKIVSEGRAVSAVDYAAAREKREVLNAGLDQIFDRYDAIVTPATTGEAPQTLDYTGNPIFCSLWTYCGVPAVTLPLLLGENGMPIGVQLIGRRGDDGRLLRTARWLINMLADDTEGDR